MDTIINKTKVKLVKIDEAEPIHPFEGCDEPLPDLKDYIGKIGTVVFHDCGGTESEVLGIKFEDGNQGWFFPEELEIVKE